MNGKRHDRLRTLLPTAGEWRWCLYDVANSAFSLIVMTTMFPFFYARFVVPPDAPPGSATAGLGFALQTDPLLPPPPRLRLDKPELHSRSVCFGLPTRVEL